MLALLLPLAPAVVQAGDVKGLLERVGAAATSPVTLRAEGQLERTDAEPLPIVLLTRDDAVYVEARDGVRILVKQGKAVAETKGDVREIPTSTALAASDILLEDLAPVSATRFEVPQVSDESPDAVVITGAPRSPSAYVLLVMTVEPERAVVERTKYYRETVTNLVKMRRDSEFALVGGRWRPGRIVVEQFRPPRTTRLTLTWKEAPEIGPEAFQPSAMEKPSPIRWAER
jgi:hypothetical protein